MALRRVIAPMLAMVILGVSLVAFAQYQQPTPGENEVGPKPTPTYPEPRGSTLRGLDLALFVVILAAGTYAIIRLRSRRLMLALLGATLLYFGLWRSGCVCSIGAIQNVALSLADRTYTISIFITIIVLLPVAAALLFGRVFCGSLCPLGALQEWINPTRWHLHIPRRLDIALGYLRWAYLAAAIWMAIGGLALFALDLRTAPRFLICMLDPFVNVFRMVNLRTLTGGAGELFLPVDSVLGWGLTIAILAVSVVIVRPYCRWICPYGAVLGACSRAAKWPVTLSPALCPDCELCEPACPVNAIRRGVIDPIRCIACGRCHAACPVLRYERGIPAGEPLSQAKPSAAHEAEKPHRTAIDTARLERIDETPDMAPLEKILADIEADGDSGALKMLMDIQAAYGYLPADVLDAAAARTGRSTAELLEISSFYNMFRHEPVGEHIVSVCHGTACHVAGAPMVTDALRRHLNIGEGHQTDPTRLFTVEKVACLGCCSLAPVMQVDGVTYGHVTGESACEIIDLFAKGKGPKPAADATGHGVTRGGCGCRPDSAEDQA